MADLFIVLGFSVGVGLFFFFFLFSPLGYRILSKMSTRVVFPLRDAGYRFCGSRESMLRFLPKYYIFLDIPHPF